MVVGYGVTVPRGNLGVFSVDTVEEARRLLTTACETNLRGEYLARELTREQTADNLLAFADRLERAYEEHRDYIVGGPRGLDARLVAARDPLGRRRFYPEGEHPAGARLRAMLAQLERDGLEESEAADWARGRLAIVEGGEAEAKRRYLAALER